MKKFIGSQRGQAYKMECGSDFYDNAFTTYKVFQSDYHTSYYSNLYRRTIELLRIKGCRSVLELGCGNGTFASMVFDTFHEIDTYTGIDFSPVGIKKAKQKCPQFNFYEENLYETKKIEQLPYDTIVAHELLEHLRDDIGIIRRIKNATPIFASVPSFDDQSHIRFFTDENQIRSRYGRCIDIEEILFIDKIFLFYGKTKTL